MSLDEFTKVMIAGKLRTFCEQLAASDSRDVGELTYSFWRASVILYERRRIVVDPKKWIRTRIARVDFDEDSRGWTLWTYDPDDRPQRYPYLPEAIDFDAILGEVDRDPECIFWE